MIYSYLGVAIGTFVISFLHYMGNRKTETVPTTLWIIFLMVVISLIWPVGLLLNIDWRRL